MTTPPPGNARRDILMSLAQTLTMLAGNAQAQTEVARDIAALAVRAEEIGFQARLLSTARNPAGSEAQALAADLRKFLGDVTTLSEEAARRAGASRDIAHSMQLHATDLAGAARELDGIDDIVLIRARLRPLAAALSEIPARLRSSSVIAAEVAALAPRANDLADRTQGLHEAGRTPGIVAISIYRSLREFADVAGAIADTLAVEAEQARDTITDMTRQIVHLAAPEQRAPPDTAGHRLRDVIAASVRAPRRAPDIPPLRGREWTVPR